MEILHLIIDLSLNSKKAWAARGAARNVFWLK